MRVLLVNKFLYPKGGAETYVFKLGSMLEDKGHTVSYFGLENEKNIVGNAVGAYVSDIDFSTGIKKNLTAPFRIIYSLEARKKLRLVLETFIPDVVHLNNIHFHLTPSIIDEVERYRRKTGKHIRIIYTAHDYQLVCPSHGLFDTQLNVCEKCLGGNYTHCVKSKCMKNSRMKSLLAAADAYLWKRKKTYGYIDAIICPSHFIKSKLDIQERFASKTVMLGNFTEVDGCKEPVSKDGYVLQFGHLSKEKGTYTLLEAARRMLDVRFVFAGYGKAVNDIMKTENAEYVGFKTGEELKMLVKRAKVSVCASEMYENCPYSVMESQIYLTPVIGADIGGIPELIAVGETGELFEPGNADELFAKIDYVLNTPGVIERYTENCKKQVFESPETYYDKLMVLYGG